MLYTSLASVQPPLMLCGRGVCFWYHRSPPMIPRLHRPHPHPLHQRPVCLGGLLAPCTLWLMSVRHAGSMPPSHADIKGNTQHPGCKLWCTLLAVGYLCGG